MSQHAELILKTGYGRTPAGARAQRLPAATRRLAARYLAGEFGAAMREADFSCDMPENASPAARYAAAILAIARHAPLRLLSAERLVGAATLLEATRHETPLLGTSGTSHTTIDFEKVLRVGYRGIRAELDARLARHDLDDAQRDYLLAMRACLDAADLWQQRYRDALAEALVRETDGDIRRNYRDIAGALRSVPDHPPTSFRAAVQSLWSAWTFQRLCGNWSGLGRVDKMLGPFLQRDLAAGRITRDDARDLLAHFWIKGCEWIAAPGAFGSAGTGDAQFYQNVILAGVDESGQELTNDVTYLVLDIVDELHISDFPIAVRVGAQTPARLWRRIAEVQRGGSGIVSIYHEDLVIRALTRCGFPLEEARNFTNDGCWETLIPGKTAFAYVPFDVLQLLQDTLGLAGDAAPAYATFEELYAAFRERLAAQLTAVMQPPEWTSPPVPLLALLVEGCIEQARDYHAGGPRYTVRAPHAGGLPDVANSLYVIRDLIFQRQRLSLREFVDILRRDWDGAEALRAEIARTYTLYGNGEPAVDTLAQRVFDDFVTLVEQQCPDDGILRPPGISTFGREIGWRRARLATAFGTHAHAILAGNLEPTPGTERHGPTAVIQSYCGFDFARLPNGAPLTLRLLPSSVAGEDGLRALIALLQTFVALGGWYLQLDSIDAATLRDAQAHPDRYPNLTVRISGWSARFATLDREWQEMVIQRTDLAL